MNILIEYWYVILALAVVAFFIGVYVSKFFKQPTEQQIDNFKQWLRYAVIEAEKKLGKGTGQLKLRTVYDWAVVKFPWVAIIITFEQFSMWVDEALDWMANALTNEHIDGYIQDQPVEK